MLLSGQQEKLHLTRLGTDNISEHAHRLTSPVSTTIQTQRPQYRQVGDRNDKIKLFNLAKYDKAPSPSRVAI